MCDVLGKDYPLQVINLLRNLPQRMPQALNFEGKRFRNRRYPNREIIDEAKKVRTVFGTGYQVATLEIRRNTHLYPKSGKVDYERD